jgi:hypothetical protein
MNRFAHLQTRVHLAILFLVATIAAVAAAPAETGTADEIEALDSARFLTKQVGTLPIVLTGVRPGYVSDLAEAWTVRDPQTGDGVILVYTGSAAFRCAMRPHQNYQCTIKLASILVHEAWHLKYGADERYAYDAQLRFLKMYGSGQLVNGVRRARATVLARPHPVAPYGPR